jgi:hypothetical protein
MLVIGCISAQLLFRVSKTYDPVTDTWLPTGGMLRAGWLKLLQADPTSDRDTVFWHIASNTKSPFSNLMFAWLIRLLLSANNLIWKSPSFTTCTLLITPVAVIQGFTIWSLVGRNTCCHNDLSHVGVTAACAVGEDSTTAISITIRVNIAVLLLINL